MDWFDKLVELAQKASASAFELIKELDETSVFRTNVFRYFKLFELKFRLKQLTLRNFKLLLDLLLYLFSLFILLISYTQALSLTFNLTLYLFLHIIVHRPLKLINLLLDLAYLFTYPLLFTRQISNLFLKFSPFSLNLCIFDLYLRLNLIVLITLTILNLQLFALLHLFLNL